MGAPCEATAPIFATAGLCGGATATAMLAAAANPADALQCEAGYLLLGKICECNDALLSAHVAPLQPLLTAGMAAGVQPAVQLEAVRAACSLVLSLPDHAAQRSLCEAVLPNALQAIAAALADDCAVTVALGPLVPAPAPAPAPAPTPTRRCLRT